MASEGTADVLSVLEDVDRRSSKIFVWLSEALDRKAHHYDVAERMELAQDEAVFAEEILRDVKTDAGNLDEEVQQKIREVSSRLKRAKVCIETLQKVDLNYRNMHNPQYYVKVPLSLEPLKSHLLEAENKVEFQVMESIFDKAAFTLQLQNKSSRVSILDKAKAKVAKSAPVVTSDENEQMDKLKKMLSEPALKFVHNLRVLSREDLDLLEGGRPTNSLKNNAQEPAYLISNHAFCVYDRIKSTKGNSVQVQVILDLFFACCRPRTINMGDVFRYSNDCLFLTHVLLLLCKRNPKYPNFPAQLQRITSERKKVIEEEVEFLANQHLAFSSNALCAWLDGDTDEFAIVYSKLKQVILRMKQFLRPVDLVLLSNRIFMKVMNNVFGLVLHSEYDAATHAGFILLLIRKVDKELKSILSLDLECDILKMVEKKKSAFIEIFMGDKEDLLKKWFLSKSSKDPLDKVLKQEEFQTLMDKRFGTVALSSAPPTPRPVQ